jgi:hypothetical protein
VWTERPLDQMLGVVPGNARNIAAADANVGQFAIAEPIELTKALIVAAPLPKDANKMRQEHGVNPFRTGGNPLFSETKIILAGFLE